jgi:hypothetical protein
VSQREFLGKLSMPVKPAPDAPTSFNAPPLRRKSTPTTRRRAVSGGAVTEERQPDLGEFYEHILDIIRAVGRGMERTPGSFANVGEETLRDHMVVTLNTHYVGQTYAEAFNRNGKTDILIRVLDNNAFIGECKWWHGPKALHDALDQLFGYTTWRDSRVALVFYVRQKDMSAIVEKARAEMENRPEFIAWDGTQREGELRCRVHWPEDSAREATLTALFFHLV